MQRLQADKRGRRLRVFAYSNDLVIQFINSQISFIHGGI